VMLEIVYESVLRDEGVKEIFSRRLIVEVEDSEEAKTESR
jgi:hypothetical protein